MTREQVQRTVTGTADAGPDDLILRSTYMHRPAQLNFHFSEDSFFLGIVTFLDIPSKTSFDEANQALVADYGIMPNPMVSDEYLLNSTKRWERFEVMHTLVRSEIGSREQITLFRRK